MKRSRSGPSVGRSKAGCWSSFGQVAATFGRVSSQGSDARSPLPERNWRPVATGVEAPRRLHTREVGGSIPPVPIPDLQEFPRTGRPARQRMGRNGSAVAADYMRRATRPRPPARAAARQIGRIAPTASTVHEVTARAQGRAAEYSALLLWTSRSVAGFGSTERVSRRRRGCKTPPNAVPVMHR
jgi:hypothetical protein